MSILQFCTDVPVINTTIVSFVAISLPLSSLWASAAVPGQNAHPGMLNASNQQPLWKVLSSIQSTGGSSSAAYETMSCPPPQSQLRVYPTMPSIQENGDKVQLLYRGADVENGPKTFSVSS